MPFLDKKVIQTRVYDETSEETGRILRYIINRFADVFFYNPIAVVLAYLHLYYKIGILARNYVLFYNPISLRISRVFNNLFARD